MGAAVEFDSSAEFAGIGHVLAPLDGSEWAEAAVRWLSNLPSSQVTLLRACMPESTEQSEAETYLAALRDRLSTADKPVTTSIVTGCPADAIVGAAANADLVVMSTKGAGAGGRLLFGSVADRVARHSPAPTLLIRGNATGGGMKPRRIVVPLDGSPAAERALPVATSLAQALGCGVHLVNVRDHGEHPSGNVEESGAEYLRRLARTAPITGPAITTEQRTGDPAKELLAMLAPDDLVVLTTHGRGAAKRWQIGSVAEKLLRQATAPVAVVRADAA